MDVVCRWRYQCLIASSRVYGGRRRFQFFRFQFGCGSAPARSVPVRSGHGHGFGSLCSGSALVRFRFMQSQFGRGYCLVFSRLTTFMGKHHRHVVQAPVLANLHTALAILLNSLNPHSTHWIDFTCATNSLHTATLFSAVPNLNLRSSRRPLPGFTRHAPRPLSMYSVAQP